MSDSKAPKQEVEQEDQVPMRRQKWLMINPVEFVRFFTKGMKLAKRLEIIEGVPEDAELKGIVYDVRLDAIILVVQSQEYEPIPVTDLPPRQMVTLKIGVPDATKKKKK